MSSTIAMRAGALLALALFGALHWAGLTAPGEPGRLVGGVVLGAAVAGVAVALRAAGRTARLAAAAASALGATTAVLLLAGVPLRFLRPAAWDDLAAGIAEGLSALPAVGVPYDGGDPWVRVVLLAGGLVLPALAAALAFRLRRDGRPASVLPALIALSLLYAVPAAHLDPDGPRLAGLAFTVLLCAVLWLERIPRGQARSAGALIGAGLLAAFLLAPAVAAQRPLIDYEGIARDVGAGGGQGFTWDHRYGPLTWPREGREMLRIRARERQYWKAVNLTAFDGRVWRLSPPDRAARLQTTIDSSRPDWRARLEVTVRDLSSLYFVGAGSTLRIENSSARTPVPSGPGTFRTADRPLRDGHTYAAEVYVPDPSEKELDRRPGSYPAFVDEALTMRLPAAVAGPQPPDPQTARSGPRRAAIISFPDWNEQARGAGPTAGEPVTAVGPELLEDSAYARTYKLAQRMREAAGTPHELAEDIMVMFREGFVYTELPPERPVPLDAFLFTDRAGYCQQFSGAMALLLRMAGVPARVASGFSPGARDDVRDEWVVRDYDAHSWVEAYLPGAGWVVYDPTPSASPASGREGSANLETPDAQTAAPEASDAEAVVADLEAPAVADDAGGRDGGPARVALAAGAALAVSLPIAALWALRRRAAPSGDGDALAAELGRALRRAGRPAPPRATLAALEASLPDDARAYVRAVAARRYGYAAHGPTAAQRAALRRALAGGRSPRAFLRGWWALPPAHRA